MDVLLATLNMLPFLKSPGILRPSYLLKHVGLLDGLEHIFLRGFLCFATQYKLVQDVVGLFKVEDDVQFANLTQEDNSGCEPHPKINN